MYNILKSQNIYVGQTVRVMGMVKAAMVSLLFLVLYNESYQKSYQVVWWKTEGWYLVSRSITLLFSK